MRMDSDCGHLCTSPPERGGDPGGARETPASIADRRPDGLGGASPASPGSGGLSGSGFIGSGDGGADGSSRQDDGTPWLPDHRLIRVVGKGGFGEVWIGQHRETLEPVAAKIIPSNDRAKQETELAGLRQLRGKVRGEGQQHLAWIEQVGRSGEFLYCVMELADSAIPGPLVFETYEPLSLDVRLRQGRVDPEECLQIARQIAEGLAFLRSLDLQHGDLKPGNVLRVRDRWKLTDYSTLGGSDHRVRYGTTNYRPSDRRSDADVDQFALGVILHQLVTGQRPSGSVPADAWPTGRLGQELRRICLRMLKEQRSAQFAHLADVAKELETLSRRGDARGGPACHACGESIDPRDQFCGHCSAPLWSSCPFCEDRNPVARAFCGGCGGPVRNWSILLSELEQAASDLTGEREPAVAERLRERIEPLWAEIVRDLARVPASSATRRGRGVTMVSSTGTRVERLRDSIEQRARFDQELDAARRSGDPDRFESVLREARRTAPECRRFATAVAELPAMRERIAWKRRLTRLGQPHLHANALSEPMLEAALRALRLESPSDPEVLSELTKVRATLETELGTRVRGRLLERAQVHREMGRPLECLGWLRRVEARGLADDAVRSEIATTAARLEQAWLPDLRLQAERLLAGAGAHRPLRRLANVISVVAPQRKEIWRPLEAQWRQRRAAWLVDRLLDRAKAAARHLDDTTSSIWIANAMRVAGRSAELSARIEEVRVGIRTGFLEVNRRRAAAEQAIGEGRIADAMRELDRCLELAPEVSLLQAMRGEAGRLAAAQPGRRRRRLLAVAAVVLPIVAASAVMVWQGVNYLRMGAAISAAESQGGDRSLLIALRDEAADRGRLPLGDWGLVSRMDELWQRSWLQTYGEGSLLQMKTALGLNELGAWLTAGGEAAPALLGQLAKMVQRSRDAAASSLDDDDAWRGAVASWRAMIAVPDRVRSRVTMDPAWETYLRSLRRSAVPTDVASFEGTGQTPQIEPPAVQRWLDRRDLLAGDASDVPGAGEAVEAIDAALLRWGDLEPSRIGREQQALEAEIWSAEWVEDRRPIGARIDRLLQWTTAAASLPGAHGAAWSDAQRHSERLAGVWEDLDQPRMRWTAGGLARDEAAAAGHDPIEHFDPARFEFRPVPYGGTVMLVGWTEVTEAQWAAVRNERSAGGIDPALPRTGMSPAEAQRFVETLGTVEWAGRTWRAFLPIEAQWEAARRGASPGRVGEIAAGASGAVHLVPPGESRFGLRSMLGNVREWLQGDGELGDCVGLSFDDPERQDPRRRPGMADPRIGLRIYLLQERDAKAP